MNAVKHLVIAPVFAAVLLGASGMASAAYEGTRDDRMQSALDDYHRSHPSRDARNSSPGPAARAEESMKNGARRAGHAIHTGATKVGHAVGTGLRKTGAAIRHTGEKLGGKDSAPAQ